MSWRPLIRLVAFLALAGFFALMELTTLTGPHTGKTDDYAAMFTGPEGVSGLRAGNSVKVAGVAVGKVTAVDLVDAEHAKVTFTANRNQHVTNNTWAVVRYANLLGQRYLALTQAEPGGKVLPPGTRHPVGADRSGPLAHRSVQRVPAAVQRADPGTGQPALAGHHRRSAGSDLADRRPDRAHRRSHRQPRQPGRDVPHGGGRPGQAADHGVRARQPAGQCGNQPARAHHRAASGRLGDPRLARRRRPADRFGRPAVPEPERAQPGAGHRRRRLADQAARQEHRHRRRADHRFRLGVRDVRAHLAERQLDQHLRLQRVREDLRHGEHHAQPGHRLDRLDRAAPSAPSGRQRPARRAAQAAQRTRRRRCRTTRRSAHEVTPQIAPQRALRDFAVGPNDEADP